MVRPICSRTLANLAILLVSLLSSSSGAGERGINGRGREEGVGLEILFPVDGQEICGDEDLELICTFNRCPSPRISLLPRL